MLQAMNTGHDGRCPLADANTPRDAVARIESMVLMAGIDFPMRAIRQQLSRALDLIVQIEHFNDGARRITSITEVQRMEGDTVTLQDVFRVPLGHRPRWSAHLYRAAADLRQVRTQRGPACPLTWISTASAQSARSPGNRYRWRSPRPLEASASDPDGLEANGR